MYCVDITNSKRRSINIKYEIGTDKKYDTPEYFNLNGVPVFVISFN